MVFLPIFPGSPLYRAIRRLLDVTFGLIWGGISPAQPASSAVPSPRPLPERDVTRAPVAMEDDLALATWEDAEWQ